MFDFLKKRTADTIDRFRSLTVPTLAARVYFESARSKYLAGIGLPDCPADPAAMDAIESLMNKYLEQPSSISMNDALLLERLTCRLLPGTHLAGTLRTTQEHFKRLVSAEEYQAYLDGHPINPIQSPDAPEIRARIDELLDKIQQIYVFAPFREKIRSQLSLRITTVLLFLGSLTFLFISWYYGFEDRYSMPMFVVVMIVGGIGGLISVHFRIQSMPPDGDAIRGALSLYNGWFSVYFSPMIGAVSASLLYLLFRGNLISGSLFPAFEKGFTGPIVTDQLVGLKPLLGVEQFLPPIEYAKLVIWSFIAGFVERAVPDTLSRLSGALESQKFPTTTAVTTTTLNENQNLNLPDGH